MSVIRHNAAPARRRHRSGFAFVVPFLLCAGAFLVWPIIYGFWLSMTTDSLVSASPGAFAGLSNYTDAFTDPEMWRALWNTAFFTFASTVPLVLFALVMAVLVYTGLPGQWFWRLAFFAPFLLPVSTVAMVWTWLFEEDLGLINQFLGWFGASGLGWLSDDGVAMWSVVLTTVWWTVGFNFLLYLAALQSIPGHLYEAASIDGAGAWGRLWYITLPQLKRVTGVVVVLQLLSSLKVFDQIYLMTKGGPGSSTRSVLHYVYDVGFTGYQLGYAAAISYIFLALIVIVSFVRVRFTKKREAAA